MRIIAGTYRGLTLTAVGKGDAGAHLRPTADRVRESLFNVLMKYDPFDETRVLDLFAGTGALGLEALSRGAAHVTFVDDGRVAHKLIQSNITICKAHDHTHTIKRDATKLAQNPDAPYDVVFLDPPYGKSLGRPALIAAQAGGWLAPECLVIWEDNSVQSAPDFDQLDTRRYGDTHVTLLVGP